jgi:ketosteroid isomerase-like protein
MTVSIEQVLDRWATAERTGDATELGALLDDDFVGIGPVGFVLDRDAWLTRFDHGLHYERLDLDEVSTHEHGDTVIVVARQQAEGHAGEIPTPPDVRVSLTVVDAAARPRIAGIQYSFNGPPLGAPR